MTPDRRDQIGQLYARIGARLAAITAGKYGVPHDVAVDAVQDVFMDLLNKEDLAARVAAFDEAEAFRYLLAAIVHRAGRELKRRATIDARPIETIEALLSERGLTSRPPPIEMAELIRNSLQQLRSPYREVLAGLLLERQSAQQLAVTLDRPVNTIYQQTHRGLQMLKQQLDAVLKR